MTDGTPPPDINTWLSVNEAAMAYAMSTRTLRRRLASPDQGGLTARKVVTRNGEEWRIAPPTGYTPPYTSPGADTPPEPTNPQAIVLAAQQRIAAVTEERDYLRTQLEQAHPTQRESNQEIGRLRGQLDTAQAEREQLRNQAPAEEKPRRRWFWQR
jgi:chromosome segregation ATPase